MSRRKRKELTGASALASSHRDLADYNASKRETKLRPKVRGVKAQGSSADWHFRRDSDHLWVGELGREYDRNTPVGKRMLDMVVQNVLQDQGFGYNPDTGDEGLDKELKAYIDDLFDDPQRIDLQGEDTFQEMSKKVFRDVWAAGDIFGLFNEDGPIEIRESHLCRQPFARGVKHANNVLGVELGPNRQRKGFWFTKEPINPFETTRVTHKDLEYVEAWSESGGHRTRNVLHVRDAKRVSQTRGVSMFAPVFDYLGMFEDSQFQQLVKQQLSNMLLLVRERGSDFNTANLAKSLPTGVASEIVPEVDRLLEELYPGAELRGLPDEKIMPWAPNIPNSEWFEHMRLVLRIIGISWGMPYVLLMLDTADTTFHGYRGALVEARETFRGIQRSFARRWHSPVVVNYLHLLADEDKAIGRRRDRTTRERKRSKRFDLFRHRWTYPGWASVDDLKDAQSNQIRLANSQTSHRRIAQMQDAEWPALSSEIIEDKSLHWMSGIAKSIEQLKETIDLAKKIGVKIDPKTLQLADIERWANRIAPLPWADANQLSMVLDDQVAEVEPPGGTEPPKPAGKP